MTIIAVDNHEQRLMGLVKTLWSIFPDDKVLFYTDPLYALKHIFNNDVDIVFAESKMWPLNGQRLSNVVREQHKKTVVYCLTDSAEEADGTCRAQYIARPVTAAAIKGILQTA